MSIGPLTKLSDLAEASTIRLVKQRGPYDCGVACAAMILGILYEEALADLGRDPNCSAPELLAILDDGFPAIGVMISEVAAMCFRRGIPAIHVYPAVAYKDNAEWFYRMLTEQSHLLPSYPTIEWVRREIDRGAVAMLGVPSLNYDDREHWVVVAGREVYDPNLKKTYGTLDEIKIIHEAVLVGKP